MLCENFQQLTIEEKIKMVGMITHAIQSDDEMFYAGKELVKRASEKGIFNGVTILPNTSENNEQ